MIWTEDKGDKEKSTSLNYGRRATLHTSAASSKLMLLQLIVQFNLRVILWLISPMILLLYTSIPILTAPTENAQYDFWIPSRHAKRLALAHDHSLQAGHIAFLCCNFKVTVDDPIVVISIDNELKFETKK